MEYTVLILILPLLTFLALGLLGTKLKPTTAGCIGTLSLAICALLAYMTAWQYFSMPGHPVQLRMAAFHAIPAY